MKSLFLSLVIFGSALAKPAVGSVGFQQVTMVDPQGKPIVVGIWYPSSGPVSLQSVGMYKQEVSVNGAIEGTDLPLILISHGTGGSFASHYDTALALAQAGFVVAALTYTGDNYADQSYTGKNINLINRNRQTKFLTDYMLSIWPQHLHLDANRIGIFGFSLGGFTALVEVGGIPDLRQTALLCKTRPDAPECAFVRQRHGDQLAPVAINPTWVHDSCVKAAVVAAPAVGFLFASRGLRNVTVAIQLWRAEKDTQAPDAWNSAVIRKGLPRPPETHVVRGADHYVFLAPCSLGLAEVAPQVCTDAPGFNRTSFHKTFNNAVVAFFRSKLNASAPRKMQEEHRPTRNLSDGAHAVGA